MTWISRGKRQFKNFISCFLGLCCVLVEGDWNLYQNLHCEHQKAIRNNPLCSVTELHKLLSCLVPRGRYSLSLFFALCCTFLVLTGIWNPLLFFSDDTFAVFLQFVHISTHSMPSKALALSPRPTLQKPHSLAFALTQKTWPLVAISRVFQGKDLFPFFSFGILYVHWCSLRIIMRIWFHSCSVSLCGISVFAWF